MTGHLVFFVQLSGTNTWYLYSVPATVTVRSRKPVSVFFALAGVAASETATTVERKTWIRLLRDPDTSHLRARNCNTSPAKFEHLEKSENLLARRAIRFRVCYFESSSFMPELP